MIPPGATMLRLEGRHTTLADGIAAEVVLSVGVRSLADALFRHDPPTPFELEQAIDAVEDALTASRLRHAARGDLLTVDPRLLALPGLQAAGARLARDEVEALFQRLASASLGDPGARAGLPPGRDAAAALLILRECMHHLGYDGVRRVEDATGARSQA